MLPDELQRAFRESLVAGRYNLLLGAGISLDSTDRNGKNLPGTEDLRQELCRVTGAPANTTMSRMVPLLGVADRAALLVDRFSGCSPGRSVGRLPDFVWRRAFTFNIDDVIEAEYESRRHPKQQLEAFNYDKPFQPTPERFALYLIHLHGFAREASTPFVFSARDYARVMRGLNPWMHMLSEILPTEPFIIAGTTLNEVDLEYYLSHRSVDTPRRGTGPSLLIEPFPDVATEADCERYGLTLVAATFEGFMDWVAELVPSPPSVAELLVPDASGLFEQDIDRLDLLRFFSDFELVPAGEQPLPRDPTPFFYGRDPTWIDLDQHLDIARDDTDRIAAILDREDEQSGNPVVVLDDPGVGKSTCVRRIAHDRARAGAPVLSVKTLGGIDANAASRCLTKLKTPALLVVDNLADHATQIADLLTDPSVAVRVFVLGADRAYRREFTDIVLGEFEPLYVSLSPFAESEYRQLLERYRRFGLVANRQAVQAPEQFARRLVGDAVAVAICHVLNDFRPLDTIVDSLWDAAHPKLRTVYLCVALAHHCHRSGLRYSLIQGLAGPRAPIRQLLDDSAPLRLAESTIDLEFLIPLSSIVAERLVHRIAKMDPTAMRGAFETLAAELAPHVTRHAIIRRSPEARLAGRLFDADTIVRPLLGDAAADFYSSAQEVWEWNSRYWEQRALLTLEDDLDRSLQFARHAVGVEKHPFPLTTLGKILLATMDADLSARDAAYQEALTVLSEAIEIEVSRSRISVHPFSTLIAGTARYVELGGVLNDAQWQFVERYANEAERRLSHDPVLTRALRQFDEVLGNR